MNDEQKGILFTILTSISLALNLIFGRLVVNSISVELGNTLWFMFASILYIILFVFARKGKNFRFILEKKKEMLVIGFLSFVGSIFWMYGILYAGTNNMAFVFEFNIVFTVLLGVIFLKDRFRKIEVIGALIAIFGIFILAYDNIEISILSIVIILISALFNALSNLVSKIFVKKISPVTLAGGRAIFIFLLSLGYALVTNRIQTNIPSMVFLYAFLGGVTGAFVGFSLFYKSLEKIKISKVMTIRTIEPFLVVALSFFIFSMIPTQNQLIGGSLIVIGVIILILYKRNKNFEKEKLL